MHSTVDNILMRVIYMQLLSIVYIQVNSLQSTWVIVIKFNNCNWQQPILFIYNVDHVWILHVSSIATQHYLCR